MPEHNTIEAKELGPPRHHEFVGFSSFEIINRDPLVGFTAGIEVAITSRGVLPVLPLPTVRRASEVLRIALQQCKRSIIAVAGVRRWPGVVVALDADVTIIRHIRPAVVRFLGTMQVQVIKPGLVDLEVELQRRSRGSCFKGISQELQISTSGVARQGTLLLPKAKRRRSILHLHDDQSSAFIIGLGECDGGGGKEAC